MTVRPENLSGLAQQTGSNPAPVCGVGVPQSANTRQRKLSKRIRRWLRSELTALAVRLAPQLSESAAEGLAAVIASCGRHLPPVARMVAQNQRAAGVYAPDLVQAHFAALGRHFAGVLQVLRLAPKPAGRERLLEYGRQHFELDDSVEQLAELVRAGRSAVLVGPHICGYLVALALLNHRVPLSAYLRRPKSAEQQVARELWHRVSGVNVIYEPRSSVGLLRGLGRLIELLRRPGVVFITPDLPQKGPAGLAVRLLGRTVRLPGGAAVLAVRASVPLFALSARRLSDGRQVLFVEGPFELAVAERCRKHEAVAACMQWVAAQIERFICTEPALWYFWADKRWTRVFRGDPRYVSAGRCLERDSGVTVLADSG